MLTEAMWCEEHAMWDSGVSEVRCVRCRTDGGRVGKSQRSRRQLKDWSNWNSPDCDLSALDQFSSECLQHHLNPLARGAAITITTIPGSETAERQLSRALAGMPELHHKDEKDDPKHSGGVEFESMPQTAVLMLEDA